MQSAQPKLSRILLVEDEPDMREILSLILQKENFEVIEASNGEEALKKLDAAPPQLVLCDLMMPVMGGKEFLAKLRADVQTRQIPVIILTAVDSEENEITLLDIGATDFISKAASTSVVITRIKSALARVTKKLSPGAGWSLT